MNCYLTIRDLNVDEGTNFITLATVEDGFITSIKSDVQYADLMDTLAQRTYEESGNYTVNAFKINIREDKKAYPGDPNGASLDGDESKFQEIIHPGVAYVLGYRQETIYDNFLKVPKARTTKIIENGSLYYSEHAYVDLVSPAGLSVWANNPSSDNVSDLVNSVKLYDGEPINDTPSGNIIGEVYITDANFISEDTINGTETWRYFITGLKFYTGKSSVNVKCVSNETSRFLALPLDNEFKVFNADKQNLFWALDKENNKSLRDSDDPDKGSIYNNSRQKFRATLS